MKKFAKQLIILIFLIIILVLPYFVFAQTPLQKLEEIQPLSGYASATGKTAPEIVGMVIRVFLSILGVIFVSLMIFGGYHWMTARGNEQEVEKAKDILRRATVGLIIVLSSYAITQYVIFRLLE